MLTISDSWIQKEEEEEKLLVLVRHKNLPCGEHVIETVCVVVIFSQINQKNK